MSGPTFGLHKITSFKTQIRRCDTGWRWLVLDKIGSATFGQGIEKTQNLAARAARLLRCRLMAENPQWQFPAKKFTVRQ